ncbi:hypothetical protein [Halococcus sp. IIIV-5B]|uniref:hypothetical protein n=1 Tax=Halococcus sp. IIIV-5B TaxID=2321230 RepID=UPI0011C45FD8|nr:hypothetical protein [Halococcus sp. IIIV-5B]
MEQSTPHRNETNSEQAEDTVALSGDQSIPDTPSSNYFSLDEDEELLWEGREGPKELVPGLLCSLLFVLAGGAVLRISSLETVGEGPPNAQLLLIVLGGVILFVAVGIAGYTYWSHRKKYYAVTTKSTYRRRGDYISVIAMTDIVIANLESRSPLDKFLSSGDLAIKWQEDGEKVTTYRSVPDPETVCDLIAKGTYGSD